MRKTIYLFILLAALSGLARAGDMPQPIAPPSTPAGATAEGEMPQPLTETIVTVIETVLSLV